MNSFMNERRQILFEQIAGDKIILIFDNVGNKYLYSLDLMMLQGNVDGVCVVVVLSTFFDVLVSVDNGIFFREVLRMTVVE